MRPENVLGEYKPGESAAKLLLLAAAGGLPIYTILDITIIYRLYGLYKDSDLTSLVKPPNPTQLHQLQIDKCLKFLSALKSIALLSYP